MTIGGISVHPVRCRRHRPRDGGYRLPAGLVRPAGTPTAPHRANMQQTVWWQAVPLASFPSQERLVSSDVVAVLALVAWSTLGALTAPAAALSVLDLRDEECQHQALGPAVTLGAPAVAALHGGAQQH